MILTAYKYLYYRSYSWNLRMWGESDLPQSNALIFVSFFASLNLISIETAIDLLTGRSFFDYLKDMGQVVWVGLFFAVLISSYFLLVADRKFKKVVKKFSSETKSQRKIKLSLIWLYLIGSFVVAFGLIAIRNSK